MVFVPVLLGALALKASAFPFVFEELTGSAAVVPRAGTPGTGTPAEIAASKARTNCGPNPCLTFDPVAQFVSLTGEHAYASPAADEIRGPCPGLNAAANHGYLPRNGIATIQDTIGGLGSAYGMSVDLAAALAVIAIILDGDPVLGTWSIGGPPPTDPLLAINPSGISYSHNNYENDASIARFDAYLNKGDAHSLSVPRFASAYAAHNGSGFYNLDLFAQNYGKKADESISTNPYAFFGPFSGLVAPAAYNFVINFMSNHSAEQPGGYLDGEMFKTFFGLTGTYPNFKWIKGQERIPENWYRRPMASAYSAANVIEDLVIQFLAYPNSFYLGGNVGKTNSFVGFDFANLTNGVYNGKDLLNGDNLGCFFFSAATAGIPSFADLPLKEANAIDSLISQYLAPITSKLNCTQLAPFSQNAFNQYPGYKYNPKGPATNYKN